MLIARHKASYFIRGEAEKNMRAVERRDWNQVEHSQRNINLNKQRNCHKCIVPGSGTGIHIEVKSNSVFKICQDNSLVGVLYQLLATICIPITQNIDTILK